LKKEFGAQSLLERFGNLPLQNIACFSVHRWALGSCKRADFSDGLEMVSRSKSVYRYPPCQIHDHRVEQAEVIDNWLVSIKTTERQRRRALNCLDEGHLRSLPVCPSIPFMPKVLKAKNWHILFYSNIAHILRCGTR
jgi:hypothetical protein